MDQKGEGRGTGEMSSATHRGDLRLRQMLWEVPATARDRHPLLDTLTQVVEMEAKLDQYIAQSLHPLCTMGNIRMETKKLYVYIRTFHNAPNPLLSKPCEPSDSTPTHHWSVVIDGKVDAGVSPSFLEAVSRIVVELDANYDHKVFEWSQQSLPNDTFRPGVEFSVVGDQPCKMNLYLTLAHPPPFYKVLAPLDKIFSAALVRKRQALDTVWRYIHLKGLLDPQDPKTVLCDAILRESFGKDKIDFSSVPLRVNECLAPMDPLLIQYDVHFDHNKNDNLGAFSIDIPWPCNDAALPTSPILSPEEDFRLCKTLRFASALIRRAEFMEDFSKSPTEVMCSLVRKKVLDGRKDPTELHEQCRRSELYGSNEVAAAAKQLIYHSTRHK